MDRGAWLAGYTPWGLKESDMTCIDSQNTQIELLVLPLEQIIFLCPHYFSP